MPGLELVASRMDLEALQLDKLRAMVRVILPANRFYADKFADAKIDPRSIRTLADLARLPFTTKEELLDDQSAYPPYGTNLTYPIAHYCRLHQTSGTTKGQPLRWLDTKESWDWFMECWRITFDAMRITPADRFFFPFSFGPFIGFWAAFEGAVRRGNLCISGGGLSSSPRLRLMLENAVTIVCCTPTYALRLAEVAGQEGLDLPKSPVRALIVAGEPGGSIPATRKLIEESWGARVFDHTGMTEIGSLGIECVANPGGVHLLETECIAEIVDGELVLTNLGRWGSPLIRYRTGDRVIVDPDPCPCGSILVRLKGGILGRTDDMLIVRGNNVYPSAIENVIRRFPQIHEFLIEVSASNLCLQIEPKPGAEHADLVEQVRETIRNELSFRPEVVVVPPGSLPRSEMKSRRVIRKM